MPPPANIIRCKFCLQDGEKVKGHIIPEAFFRDVGDGKNVLKQREIGQFALKRPIGIYDDKSWCAVCEKLFQPLDAYAIDVLRTPESKFDARDPRVFRLDIHSPGQLRLFFISLAWRASVTEQRFYQNMALGPFEAEATSLLAANDVGTLHQFSTLLASADGDPKLIFEPIRVRHFGINFRRFYLGRFMADIKVDGRQLPKELLSHAISSDGALAIRRTEASKSMVNATSLIAQQLRKVPAAERVNRR